MAVEFPGLVVSLNRYHVLVHGPDADALGAPLFGPPVYLRPGYRFVARDDYLLPHAVVDDIGQQFSAPFCYEWIEQRGDAFPRADVIGLRSSGEAETVFMKELDLPEMALFAVQTSAGTAPLRIHLAIEALASPDGYALVPVPLPVDILSRAVPSYRLAPGVFGAIGAAILLQLLATGRRDWRLTFDDVDDLFPH